MTRNTWVQWLKWVVGADRIPAKAYVRVPSGKQTLRIETLDDRRVPCASPFAADMDAMAANDPFGLQTEVIARDMFAMNVFSQPQGMFDSGPGMMMVSFQRMPFGFGFGGFGGGFFGGSPWLDAGAGEASTEATHFDVRLMSEAYSGEEARIAVVALDEFNQPVLDYSGTVHFTSTDPSAVLPDDYTFTPADRGVHVFEITAPSVGDLTISVSEATTDDSTETPTEEPPTPIDDTVPADGTIPDDGTIVDDPSIPVDDTTPTDDTVPADDPTAPVDDTAPTDDSTVPVDETTPTDETTPVDDTVPTDDPTTPVDDTVPADATLPTDETHIDDGHTHDDGTEVVDDTVPPDDTIIPDDTTADVVDETDPALEDVTDVVETPVDETIPADDTVEEPVDDTVPVDDVIDDTIPVDDTPEQPVPVDDVIDETIPTDDEVVDDVIDDTIPVDATTPDDEVVDDTPTDEVIDDVIDDTTPTDETPTEETPTEETPVDETPTEEPTTPPVVDDDAPVVGTITINVTEAPAATHFEIRSLPSAFADQPTRFMVVALDESNNVATAYNGTVHLSSTDAAATLPEDLTFTDDNRGVYVFTAEFDTTGTQTISASDTANAELTGAVALNVLEAPDLSDYPGFGFWGRRWFW
jgi:hypothetical protein